MNEIKDTLAIIGGIVVLLCVVGFFVDVWRNPNG